MQIIGHPLSDDQKQTPIPSLAAKKAETFKMKLQSLPERIPAFGLFSALFGKLNIYLYTQTNYFFELYSKI